MSSGRSEMTAVCERETEEPDSRTNISFELSATMEELGKSFFPQVPLETHDGSGRKLHCSKRLWPGCGGRQSRHAAANAAAERADTIPMFQDGAWGPEQ
ncbi:unnamed protein product [Boreogadus saida]